MESRIGDMEMEGKQNVERGINKDARLRTGLFGASPRFELSSRRCTGDGEKALNTSIIESTYRIARTHEEETGGNGRGE
jgi:hypothetical protein